MEESTADRAGGSALKAMVSFFTIWQQDITQEDMDAMERSFHLVPLIGAFFGIVLIVAMSILFIANVKLGFGSSMIYAIVALAMVWVGSKFIHFDGLTDFGDGMIVSGAREDHVRALKDTLVGAGGIGVAVTVVLLSFSLYSCAGAYLLLMAPFAEILVKNAMVAAAAFGKPGNGMAGRQVAMTTVDSVRYSSILSLALAFVFSILTAAVYKGLCRLMDLALLPEIGFLDMFIVSLFGLVASVAVGYLMARKANSVFGMVNGDILGATNEICRPVVMVAMLIPFLAWL